ncbi:MAG TPA: tetratricopeptide repeat protein [Candidatus Binatia bacterium]|jgi:tetratricopeptide (TPR) repeat protein
MSKLRHHRPLRTQRNFDLSPTFSDWAAATLIVGFTAIVFSPTLRNGFVNWDDYENIVNNPHYRGLGWDQLLWMFTTFHHSLYRPLTWVSLGLDYILWGTNPTGYHLTSILLHAANAVLLFFLTKQLLALRHGTAVSGRALPIKIAAAVSALVFAVHPLRVEPVAWVSARNDVLAGFFLLLTVIFYLEYARRKVNGEGSSGYWYAAAIGAYACSLLSKASGITLPVVLLVLDVYPLGRLGKQGWFGLAVRKVWWEKIPFLFLAVVTGLVAVAAKYKTGSIASVENYGFAARAGQSLYGLAFYLWKSLLPLQLSPLYQMPPDFTGLEPWVLTGALFAATIVVVLFLLRTQWPAGLASLLCYVVFLVPVLGFLQSGPQLVADRYSYLSCISIAVLAGAGVHYFCQGAMDGRIHKANIVLGSCVAVLLFVSLAVLTWRQSEVWRDPERLWHYVLSTDGESLFARNNLGNALALQGRFDEAIDQFQRTLRINPNDADAAYNLGNALAQQGKFAAAATQLEQALKIKPGHAMAAYDLGNIRVKQGRVNEAIDQFQQALKSDPDLASAHYNLAQIFSKEGKLDNAIRHYHLALRIDPRHVKARYYLAVALAEEGDLEGAANEFREALRFEPTLAEAHAGLGRVLSTQGKKDEAVQHYQEAVRLLKTESQSRNEPSSK